MKTNTEKMQELLEATGWCFHEWQVRTNISEETGVLFECKKCLETSLSLSGSPPMTPDNPSLESVDALLDIADQLMVRTRTDSLPQAEGNSKYIAWVDFYPPTISGISLAEALLSAIHKTIKRMG